MSLKSFKVIAISLFLIPLCSLAYPEEHDDENCGKKFVSCLRACVRCWCNQVASQTQRNLAITNDLLDQRAEQISRMRPSNPQHGQYDNGQWYNAREKRWQNHSPF